MVNKNKILIVDDSKFNRTSFAEILKEDYVILEAADGKAALEVLEKNPKTTALIILDLVMPVMDGFEFLEKVKEIEEYRYIPIIVATANDDEENEKKCLELGAWDFIPKTFHRQILKFRVKNAIDKSKVRELEYDELTEIYTQQKFQQVTKEMLDNGKDRQFTYIYFYVDQFQRIISYYGVHEGDRLIRRIAAVIKKKMGIYGEGTFGRITNNVFGMCLPFEKKEDIAEMVDEIQQTIGGFLVPYHIETYAGIYIIEDNAMSLSRIFGNANIAARNCKGLYMEYKNFYTKEMGENVKEEQEIVNAMEAALRDQEFVVYFQPKYELEGYSPYGAEALVRWQKPDGSLVSPGKFIPIFEKNGFIIKLDYYVWEKVCCFIRSELDAGREPAPISVNVSRVNLNNPKFLDSMIDLVEKYKISPKYLNLELTESVFSDNQLVLQRAVKYLRKAGFMIFMDDFGSGYSSLNVLKDLDLDVLKIDMKFMSKGQEERGTKILKAVISMAQSLQMVVIAEGVEEKEQVEMLKEMGCQYIQGYYFAKPMPEVQYRELIDEERQAV